MEDSIRQLPPKLMKFALLMQEREPAADFHKYENETARNQILMTCEALGRRLRAMAFMVDPSEKYRNDSEAHRRILLIEIAADVANSLMHLLELVGVFEDEPSTDIKNGENT